MDRFDLLCSTLIFEKAIPLRHVDHLTQTAAVMPFLACSTLEQTLAGRILLDCRLEKHD